LVLIVALPFSYSHFILDWQGRPFCHKVVESGFKMWMGDQGLDFNSNTNAFPNVDGRSWQSLAAIQKQMNGTNWARNYRYVPGLRENDPGDLVLLYLDQPTRWTWHGPPPTIFKEKRWILVPVDFAPRPRPGSSSEGGELSERVTEEEFKRRLKGTIEFVRTNERPHWQTIVAEHTRFLESIERKGH
jgi:hypothetical protein